MSGLGNKEILAKKLSELMREKGIDRNEMCDALEFKYSTVSEWLSANKYPRIDKIELMANYFGVLKSRLIENHVPTQTDIGSIETANIHMIPVFDSVSAGFGTSAIDYVTEYAPAVIINPHDVEDSIYINVKGNSMYPKIEDGDRILVHRQTSVDSGSVAVVLIDNEEAVVKKVVYGKTWIELHSFNPEYPIKRFEGEEVLRLQVLGLVKQIIKDI